LLSVHALKPPTASFAMHSIAASNLRRASAEQPGNASLRRREQRRERGRILEVLNRQPVQSRREVAGAAVPVINKLPCDA
jgi:hypothetical protein